MVRRRGLARSDRGDVIHTMDCRHARIPWRWADTVQDDELNFIIVGMGYRMCLACNPSLRKSRPHGNFEIREKVSVVISEEGR